MQHKNGFGAQMLKYEASIFSSSMFDRRQHVKQIIKDFLRHTPVHYFFYSLILFASYTFKSRGDHRDLEKRLKLFGGPHPKGSWLLCIAAMAASFDEIKYASTLPKFGTKTGFAWTFMSWVRKGETQNGQKILKNWYSEQILRPI